MENTEETLSYSAYLELVSNIDVYCGRKILYAPYKPSEMTRDNIRLILQEVFTDHLYNRLQINYLYNYYKGVQPILSKEKTIRPEINNKVLENNAFNIVEFKKGYVFGEPVQYVQRGDTSTEEISKLNQYMLAEDKSTKDKDLAEWMYIAGQGYRIILPDIKVQEDYSPFEIYTLDPRNTFVVYSSKFEHEKLFAGTYYDYRDLTTRKLIRKFSIYTDKNYFEFTSNIYDPLKQPKNIVMGNSKPHSLGQIPIIEYPLNPSRLGLVELVMSIFNTVNKISSNDMDGIEQFIQSLLVFVNQDIDEADLVDMLALGAIKISSSEPNKPADLKLLVSQISHSETKIFYERLMNSALYIAGVPARTDKASGGDTGQARLLGEGWTIADMRAKQDELAFIKAEKETIKLALLICKDSLKSEVKTLKIEDIDVKFTRNKSDNLLVKAQGLLNMFEAQIDPETAFTVCGLFSDPHSAYMKAKSLYGDLLWKIKRNDKFDAFETQEDPNSKTNTNTVLDTSKEDEPKIV